MVAMVAIAALLTNVSSTTAQAVQGQRAAGPSSSALSDTLDNDCAVLEVRIPQPDSMRVWVSQPQCGPVHLVLVGQPRFLREGERHSGLVVQYQTGSRLWEIPVALENAGRESIPLPIAMEIDSVNPIQRDRVLNAFYARDYFEFLLWEGQEMQQPWRFDAPAGVEGPLAPGARTETRLLVVGTHLLSQDFRVAFDIRGARPRRPYAPYTRPADRLPKDTLSLGLQVEHFIRAADFPALRSSYPIFRQPERDLLIFGVSFGSPQDCPSGCFYSGAIGLRLGRKLGWIDIRDYDNTPGLDTRIRRGWFLPTVEDWYLFSRAFLDTLYVHFGEYEFVVEQVVLPLVSGSPHAPRDLLVHLAERLYARVDQSLARLLTRAPVVQSDPEILTLLAGLPNGGPPYEKARRHALEALLRLGPELVRDPYTSERTLFLLALAPQPVPADTTLIHQLVDHPKVRSNPATLTVLLKYSQEAKVQLLGSLRALERVKRLLVEYLERRTYPDGGEFGARLLSDPEAGSNPDVLAVLANLTLSSTPEITLAASRRLPEGALMRWEPSYVPAR